MDRKTFTIVMGIALVVSLFLPLFKIGGSAFDMVKSGGSWENYLWLLIPISGLILAGSELNNRAIANRNLWTWLPLLTILFFLVIYPLIKKESISGDMFKSFAIGMWVALIASLLLALYNPRERGRRII